MQNGLQARRVPNTKICRNETADELLPDNTHNPTERKSGEEIST